MCRSLQVTRHISYTSHVTRHTSHVTRHTSHVTRHTSQGFQANAISRFSFERSWCWVFPIPFIITIIIIITVTIAIFQLHLGATFAPPPLRLVLPQILTYSPPSTLNLQTKTPNVSSQVICSKPLFFTGVMYLIYATGSLNAAIQNTKSLMLRSFGVGTGDL